MTVINRLDSSFFAGSSNWLHWMLHCTFVLSSIQLYSHCTEDYIVQDLWAIKADIVWCLSCVAVVYWVALISYFSARHQLKLQDHGPVCRTLCLFTTQHMNCMKTESNVCQRLAECPCYLGRCTQMWSGWQLSSCSNPRCRHSACTLFCGVHYNPLLHSRLHCIRRIAYAIKVGKSIFKAGDDIIEASWISAFRASLVLRRYIQSLLRNKTDATLQWTKKPILSFALSLSLSLCMCLSTTTTTKLFPFYDYFPFFIRVCVRYMCNSVLPRLDRILCVIGFRCTCIYVNTYNDCERIKTLWLLLHVVGRTIQSQRRNGRAQKFRHHWRTQRGLESSNPHWIFRFFWNRVFAQKYSPSSVPTH